MLSVALSSMQADMSMTEIIELSKYLAAVVRAWPALKVRGGHRMGTVEEGAPS